MSCPGVVARLCYEPGRNTSGYLIIRCGRQIKIFQTKRDKAKSGQNKQILLKCALWGNANAVNY